MERSGDNQTLKATRILIPLLTYYAFTVIYAEGEILISTFHQIRNVSDGTMKVVGAFLRKTDEDTVGISAYLGEECSVVKHQNEDTISKQIECQCLEALIPNLPKIIRSRADSDYNLNMSNAAGNTLFGHNLQGTLMNGADLATGYHGDALHLDGVDDFVDFGFQGDSCFGNVTLCENGLTVAFWLLPVNITVSKQWYFGTAKPSAIGLQLVQEDSTFIARVRTESHTWAVMHDLTVQWTLITVVWDPDSTFRLFIDSCLHDEVSAKAKAHTKDVRYTVIGKSPNKNEQYASAVIDEFTFWENVLEAEDILRILLE